MAKKRQALKPGWSWDSYTNQPMPTSLLRSRNARVQAEMRRILPAEQEANDNTKEPQS